MLCFYCIVLLHQCGSALFVFCHSFVENMKTPFIKTENQALGRPDIDTFKSIDKRFVVVLDEVRSSDAFLVEELMLCGITPTPPSKEIRKTALGAEQSVAWSKWPSTLEAIDDLKKQG